jgi:hypothetical protein
VIRRTVAAVGAAVALVGLVALAVPSVTTSLPTDDAVVTVLAVVLLLGEVREIQRRRHTAFQYAETSDTELTLELPTPGDEFDRELSKVTMTRFNQIQRQHIRDEVREVAVETVQRRERCTEEEARELIREGAWTDDPFAVAFFTRRAPRISRRKRLRELVSSTPPFRRRTVAAIEAIHRLAEGTDE